MVSTAMKRRGMAARVTAAVNIAEARKQAGLSQEQASELLGINQSALSRLESGITPITVSKLAEISTAYVVSFQQLVEGV